MLFNSYEFIFVFFPITFGVYFYLNYKDFTRQGKIFLVLSSLFFYSWWNVFYLPIILISITFNYYLGKALSGSANKNKKILILGIIANLSLLIYFKYTDFFIENFNLITNSDINLLHLVLPLAISFFTFQQIAYLVDSYRQDTKEYNFINYCVFVTFFPQLIAGPIVHHREMMPQFSDGNNNKINYLNISIGIYIFAIGLFKKVIIADTFSTWATTGFDIATTLNLVEAWVTSLSYTFQLYFDFSGYTDMAIGIALVFNIKLPINFNSPYKAVNIQDFWRRWHITLSRFLRDYIYIPLGGSRKSNLITYQNLLITFVLGGIWHGAGWTFIIWGLLHGLAIVIQRIWSDLNIKINIFISWFVTFNFINIAWIFFRANKWEDATKVLSSMFDLNNIVLPSALYTKFLFLQNYGIKFGMWLEGVKGDVWTLVWLVIAFILVLFCKNSIEKMNSFKPTYVYLFKLSLMFIFSVLYLYNNSDFLYFNF